MHHTDLWTKTRPRLIAQARRLVAVTAMISVLGLNTEHSRASELITVSFPEVWSGDVYVGLHLSANGQTVAGTVGENHMFRWNRDAGFELIEVPQPHDTPSITKISADGSVIVGLVYIDVWNAFAWSETNGFVSLDTPAGYQVGNAHSVSNNGDFIGGYRRSGSPRPYEFAPTIWSDTGYEQVTTSPSSPTPKTIDEVSDDGNAIVAWYSDVEDSSADGYYRYGVFTRASAGLPFEYQRETGYQSNTTAFTDEGIVTTFPRFGPAIDVRLDDHLIGTIQPLEGHNYLGLSHMHDDGSVITGSSRLRSEAGDGPLQRVVWDKYHGTREFAAVLQEQYGVDETLAEELAAGFLSGDGRTILRTIPEEGFLIFDLDWPLDTLHGDLDRAGSLDVADVDKLQNFVRTGQFDSQSDFNFDKLVDQADLAFWVHDLKQTYFGDANLDGEFNTRDLVAVFTAGQYEDSVALNSTWSTGDWNGDGDFTTSDLVKAFSDGGYEQGPRAAAHAVPEPSSYALLLAACSVTITLHSRRKVVR